MSNPLEVIDLTRPHGFLVWRGKQQAIASPTPLPVGDVMITSDGEAFGVATLGQPAQMALSEFEREEGKHCIRPEERQLLWPKAEAFYVHSIKAWKGFNEPQPIADDYEPTDEEAGLIEKGRRLPKTIIIDPEAVSLTEGGFMVREEAKGNELSILLEATFGSSNLAESEGEKVLPLYQLALVRRPTLRFKNPLSQIISSEKAHSGVMVALMLPATAAAKLALSQDRLPEGAITLPSKELHLTLCYLGKKDELEGRETIERILSTFVQEWSPIIGTVGGIGRFSNLESDGTNAFYASFNSAALPEFRQELVNRLKGAGVLSPSAYGFTPHITLAYLPAKAEVPNIALPDIEMSFNNLTLAWGDEHLTYPLIGVKKKEVTTMPYKIDDNECVVNSETGEIEKCHDTHEEAMAHLTALNINVEEKNITPPRIQTDLIQQGKAIGISVLPGLDDAITTGHEKAGRRLAGSWRDKLRAAKDTLMELVYWAEYADQVEEEESMADMLKGDSGVAVKMVSGEPWHLSWSSNAFQDRDEEIFSLKSLEQYVQENEENEVKGWFNLWHIKGTDFAEKRYQAIIGKFLFEAGPYLKDEKGRKALEFFKQYSAGHPEIAPEGWGASVEYKYLPEERKSKVYQWTWITRTSTLARGAAANIWTKSVQQEFMMNDEQRKAAEAIFGKEFTDQLVIQGQQKTKELEDAGVANKQATEPEKAPEAAPTPEPVPTPETPPAPTQADPAKLVQELAVTMQANLNEAIAPVLSGFQQQLTVLGEQFKALSDELKQVKGEQAIKQQVELPRFTFDLIRASQAASTTVTEGDALKDKKPTEAQPVNDGGSVASNYFLSAKR